MSTKKYPTNEQFLRSVYDLGIYLQHKYPGLVDMINIMRPPPQRAKKCGIHFMVLLDRPVWSFKSSWRYSLPSYPFADDNKKLEDINMNLLLDVSLHGMYRYKNDALKLFKDYDSKIRKIFEDCCYETKPISYHHETDLVKKEDVRVCHGPEMNHSAYFGMDYLIGRKRK